MTDTPQHLRAMQLANQTRLFRAHLLNEVRAGERAPSSLLFDTDPRLAKLQLFKLVDAIHRVGEGRAKRLLRAYYLHEQITLDRLSPVTKRSLAEEMDAMQATHLVAS
jgi:hypothetical protein